MRFRWWMVWLLIGPITFVMSLDRTAIVVAAPVIQKEYGFSLVEMSLILTSFSWTYAFLQVPAGWLAERVGPRRALYWANLLWSLLTAATPLGFSLGSFIAIRTALGVGQSADWPSSVLALRRWFPRRERAKGNSVLLGGLYLGPIIAAPITTAVMLNFGWRFVFYAFGALGILLGFAWWIVFRDDPASHPRVSPEEARLILSEREPEASATPPGALPMLFRSGQFWAIGVQYFFLILIQSFYTTWLPTYLVQARHFSLKSMGIFASLPWVALFCMVFIAGGIADRLAALHRIGLARARARRDRRIYHQRRSAHPRGRHAQHPADGRAALHLARRHRPDAGVDLVVLSGPRRRGDRRGHRLGEFLRQCLRVRGTGDPRPPGQMVRRLVRRVGDPRYRRPVRRGAVALRPPRASAAPAGTCCGCARRVKRARRTPIVIARPARSAPHRHREARVAGRGDPVRTALQSP